MLKLSVYRVGIVFSKLLFNDKMLPAIFLIFFRIAWLFVILGDSYDFETHQWHMSGDHLKQQQDFWFVAGMTLL